jgi:S-adenosylmethionine-diacylgycerolhomoserine-N-methlytransferase
MSIAAELRTLWHLARGSRAADSHAARLEAFYRPQAVHYDRFRERLLAGRAELIEALDIRAGQHVLELGAGTGRNAEFFAATIPSLARLTLVDLCPALLEQARARAARWPNCEVIEADATHFVSGAVDRVLLSYALSMMPAWEAVLSRACATLLPGGLLGVVDFYVSEATPPPGMVRHAALTRHFWPWWFAHDGVCLGSATLAALRARLDTVYLHEGLAAVPYLPGLRVPYFQFVGRRK